MSLNLSAIDRMGMLYGLLQSQQDCGPFIRDYMAIDRVCFIDASGDAMEVSVNEIAEYIASHENTATGMITLPDGFYVYWMMVNMLSGLMAQL